MAAIGQVAYSFSYHAAHYVIRLQEKECRRALGRASYELLCRQIAPYVQANGSDDMQARWAQVCAVIQSRHLEDTIDMVLKELRRFGTPDDVDGNETWTAADVCRVIDDVRLPQTTRDDWKAVVALTEEIVALDGGGPLLKTF